LEYVGVLESSHIRDHINATRCPSICIFFFLFLFLDGNDISIVEGGPDEAPEYETPVPSPEVV
jgi:hypothetical protein